MAYIRDIKPNSFDSHQTAGGAYMLTFLRWGNRDTKNYSDSDFLALREPMIVINDCVNIGLTLSKKSHIQSVQFIMMAGDINYSTAVHPGDFVFVNMLESDAKLFGKNGSPQAPTEDSLYSRAASKKAINKKDDGFKGIFKVQQSRRMMTTGADGKKRYFFQIQAAAFTEFNQIIYFNSYLYDAKEREGDKYQLGAGVARDHSDQINKEPLSMRETFKKMVSYLIGTGFPANFAQQNQSISRSFNYNFLMPSEIGQLLGIGSVKRAADIFTYYTGIQEFRANAPTDEQGLNPVGTRNGTYIDSGPSPRGTTVIIGEYWNQVAAWSIINQYANTTLNELYTAFKLSPEGNVLPSVVYRQKPFTSRHFKSQFPNYKATEFLNLPRWRIDPDLIFDYSFGKEEVARINFVQIIGKSRGIPLTSELALQASMQGFGIDGDDVKRNGLKPYITVCDFDFPLGNGKDKTEIQAPGWNQLVFDWLNNGHLKENGTITCTGLEAPIACGDNLQIDDIVYHIEEITHTMTTDPEGMKHFETALKLSYGVDTASNELAPFYPQMRFDHTNDERTNDYQNGDGVLPGVSDDQNIRRKAQQNSFTPKRKPLEPKAAKPKKK